jgi:hypothetical protein
MFEAKGFVLGVEPGYIYSKSINEDHALHHALQQIVRREIRREPQDHAVERLKLVYLLHAYSPWICRSFQSCKLIGRTDIGLSSPGFLVG